MKNQFLLVEVSTSRALFTHNNLTVNFKTLSEKPRKSQNYKSCENLLQGMPSTQHVEIGGEAFYHSNAQNVNQFFS